MKLLESLKWPLTILFSIALLIVGIVLIGGAALGIPEATQTTVLRWVGGIGAFLAVPLSALLAYLARDSDGDGKPNLLDKAPHDPTNGGTAAVLIFAIAAASIATPTGCGGAQAAVSGQAEVHVATQAPRFEFYAAEDERCGAEHPDDRAAYRDCMSPARAVAAAADTYRELLEAAQDLIDAGNEDEFTAMLPELIDAARHIAEALAAAGAAVPPEVRDIVSTLR